MKCVRCNTVVFLIEKYCCVLAEADGGEFEYIEFEGECARCAMTYRIAAEECKEDRCLQKNKRGSRA